MRVEWTDNAIKHLVAIHDHIAQNSSFYARKTVDRLTRRSEQIAEFPLSGRQVPEHESPELREVIEGSYRVIYRILPERIDVIAVVHGAQLLRLDPDDLP